MNKQQITFLGIFILVLAAIVGLLASTYTLDEAEQAVVVQLGAPVGDPITKPGLHFKLPFVQEVRRFDKRSSPGTATRIKSPPGASNSSLSTPPPAGGLSNRSPSYNVCKTSAVRPCASTIFSIRSCATKFPPQI